MTIFFVALTSLISIIAFNRRDIFDKFTLNPYAVVHKKEWYRVLSHGFIHADWVHLIVNMLVLYSFGTSIEKIFKQLAAENIINSPALSYSLLYFLGMIIASVSSIYKHKDDVWYNSVGASGAVSAVLFAHIFFLPLKSVYFYALIPIPGILFGVLYLGYSHYMSKRGKDNINHEAHFLGAVFGFLFPIALDFQLIQYFLNQLF